MKKIITIIILSACFSFNIKAENVESILQKIADSSVALRNYQAKCEAVKAGNHTGLTLADPEVEFNYLWGSPAGTGHRKDISVTQHFDYATVFGLKRKEARSKDELAEISYEQAKALFRQEAVMALIDLASVNERIRETEQRIANAEILVKNMRKRMESGDASKIEVNRATLDLTLRKSERREEDAERTEIVASSVFSTITDQELLQSIGNVTIDDINTYISSMGEASLMQLQQHKANAEEDAAIAEMRTLKAAGIPEITAGYMSELTHDEKFRGITIGLSIPLWSNKGNRAKAKANIAAIKTENEEIAANMMARRNFLVNRIRMASENIAELNNALKSASSEGMMKKMLDEGAISIGEYIMELQAYYELRTKLIEERRSITRYQAELSMLCPAL